ncbi:hypothetical protein TPHA_0G03220 [Tetrapisispora phaffii CBS 4417]|uniref:U3 small nucleolar RNA-associated protein 11 n=1 Tax=Tetrapisispora phaffii (strain ATCC 24235 / CBS 4417 / NBRC 1672 / NRRL Y-8282 / UCD 70-5) TaxID=1071381 RepID=G8BW84_TETPH|nr:hypothetical protein TPHA_0G03220 [Tetrapisispora phaffii CBS 4417]CCE64162.1 hypothetical protein TPHA_0G03220 [Tetrapisispora phaffii CBS 4417]
MAKLVHNIQKKQHRERSQLSSRNRLGLLEKHKDYVKRATDYHKKEKTIKYLKEKVKSRNKDEYYHGMHNAKKDSKTNLLISNRYGKGIDETLTADQVKLLKTQDSNYIRTLRQSELSKVNKLSKNLTFSNNSTNQHKIFVESNSEMKNFKPEVYFNTSTELLNRKENRLTNDQLHDLKNNNNTMSDEVQKHILKKKLKHFRNVKSHMEREVKLKEIESRMNLQREVMKNGSKKKITDAKTGAISFKWKKQRKR